MSTLGAHDRPAAFAPRQAEESSIVDKVLAIHEGCAYARPEMAKVGSRIEESGMLVRDRGRLVFRREQGGRWNLEDWPKSEVTLGQLGRLTGYVIDDKTVAIERFIFEA